MMVMRGRGEENSEVLNKVRVFTKHIAISMTAEPISTYLVRTLNTLLRCNAIHNSY